MGAYCQRKQFFSYHVMEINAMTT